MRNEIASELMQVTMQQNSKLDPAEQRKQEMDKIYDNFAAYAEKDSCITLEEFRKYEILYSSELRKKYADHSLTPEEEENISRLSSEWYRRINPQRPVHIVNSRGEDVCPPLPPIFNRLQAVGSTEGSDIMSAFNNAASKGEGGGIMSQIAMKKYGVAFNNIYASNQDPEVMRKAVDDYTKLASTFDREVLGKNVPSLSAAESKEKYTNNDDDEVNPELEEFEFDEEE